MRRTFVGALLLLLAGCGTASDEQKKAISKQAAAYAQAFNSKDAKALAQLWAEDAEYVNPDTGAVLSGRDEIEQSFSEVFQESPEEQLEIEVESIEFPEKDLAVELGTARIGDSVSSYRAIYVKQDGQWLLSSVTEIDDAQPVSHYEHLKELEWMLGDWVDQDDYISVETSCRWLNNRNFLQRTFTVTFNDKPRFEGIQIIGWDPAQKQIQAWVYDSNGGTSTGVWSKQGDEWLINTSKIYPDGRKGSATHIIKQVSDHAFTWRSVDREVDGELLPNREEVMVVKKAGGASR